MIITIEEIRDRVERELRGKPPDGVTIDECTVIKDLGLSSLQISEIVFGLEEDHDVEFDAALAADAQTLGDLLVVANQALSEKHVGASETVRPVPATTPTQSPARLNGDGVAAIGSERPREEMSIGGRVGDEQ